MTAPGSAGRGGPGPQPLEGGTRIDEGAGPCRELRGSEVVLL